MRWPFKFYSDEGYILAFIENQTLKASERKEAKTESN